MNYDPELPGGFQDADFEMRSLTETANRISRLRKKGICTHGAYQTRPEVKCSECGKVFASEQDLHDERGELLS